MVLSGGVFLFSKTSGGVEVGAWRYSLNSLIGQSFVTRQQVDNTAIGETMFQEIVLHNLIVSMRINANISVARQAEVDAYYRNAA